MVIFVLPIVTTDLVFTGLTGHARVVVNEKPQLLFSIVNGSANSKAIH